MPQLPLPPPKVPPSYLKPEPEPLGPIHSLAAHFVRDRPGPLGHQRGREKNSKIPYGRALFAGVTITLL